MVDPPAPPYNPHAQGANGSTPDSARQDALSPSANLGLGIGIGISICCILTFISFLLYMHYSRRREQHAKQDLSYDLPDYHASMASSDTIITPNAAPRSLSIAVDKHGCPYPRQSYKVPFELKPTTSFACIETAAQPSPSAVSDRKSPLVEGHPAFASASPSAQKELPKALKPGDKACDMV